MPEALALPLYQRIERQLRDAIFSGKIAYGTKLPSAQDLASQFGTSAFTIQTALEPLVGDGLIERTRRRGSFVRGRPYQLTSVGVYFGSEFIESHSALYRELYRELSREFAGDRIRHRLWIDSRPVEEQTESPADFAAALRAREFQGLIVGQANSVDLGWLGAAGLPISLYGTAPWIPARVNFDWRQTFVQSLGDLKRRGCRSVGLISAVPNAVLAPSKDDHENLRFHREFESVAADLGLSVRPEWIRPPSSAGILDSEHERFGYDQFRELWRQTERPDGLLVYPDTAVRGVVTALLQAGDADAKRLQMVFHRNEGIPLLCPVSASWFVTNPRQIAVALVDMLKRQITGKDVQPTYITHGFEVASDSK